MTDTHSKKTNRDESPEIVKSRSQIKREMILLQKTGERLVPLSRDQIKAINMPDNLRDAVLSVKNIKSHGARKRQLKFIGSLMRKVDVKPINEALYKIARGRSITASDFHRIETWRDDLVKGIGTPMPFLPTTREELKRLGWNQLDIIIVSGDSYIDSPYIGAAVIGRVLSDAGFKVGIIAQPDVKSETDIKRLGLPRLFWGVTAGSVDSMVANYTATGNRIGQLLLIRTSLSGSLKAAEFL